MPYPVVAVKVEGIANFMEKFGKVAGKHSHKDVVVVPPRSPEFRHGAPLVGGSSRDDVLGGLLELTGITKLANAHFMEVTVDRVVGLARERPQGARSTAECNPRREEGAGVGRERLSSAARDLLVVTASRRATVSPGLRQGEPVALG